MQTFVPYGSDFNANAHVLDRQRLGKQRVEAWQIIRALTGQSRGWVNHPATKMWSGHIEALAQYGAVMCREWIARGYNDSLLEKFYPLLPSMQSDWPEWLDREDVMLSHRSNLIRKRPDIYGPIWPSVAGDLPYVWPTSVTA
jgi:hypothetical protein